MSQNGATFAVTSFPDTSTAPATTASRAAFGWVVLAYAVALAAATLLLWADPPLLAGRSILQQAFAADIVATLVIFGFSLGFANASFYDAYWSVAPPFLLAYFIAAERFFNEPHHFIDIRLVLVTLLVVAWAIRLTHNWARGWQGLNHADWRYDNLQANTGALWWLVNLLGVHLMPTVLVFLGCVSIYLCAGRDVAPLNSVDGLASLIGACALWLEYTADNELRRFRLNPTNAGKTLNSGVWAWCRHPNYLGEIGFWLALFVYAWAAVGATALTLAVWGPVAMLVLFVGISIPMIEKRLTARHGFEAHRRTTFALLPVSHFWWRKS